MPTLSASQDNAPIIAAVVVVMLALLGAAITAAIVAVLVIIRRNKSKQIRTLYPNDEKFETDNLDNPIYTAAAGKVCS